MSARADDRIWLVPNRHFVAFVHECSDPTRWGGIWHRDHIDPCATGLCRYCGEPLPVPRESGGA